MSLAQQSPFMNRFLYSFLPSLHSNIKVGLNHEQAQNTNYKSYYSFVRVYNTNSTFFFLAQRRKQQNKKTNNTIKGRPSHSQ